MQQIQLWLFLFKYSMIQDPIHIPNTSEKHLMAFKQKRFPYFGCQRAHQAERAPWGAFVLQQFPAQLDALEHTGPCLITSSCLPHPLVLLQAHPTFSPPSEAATAHLTLLQWETAHRPVWTPQQGWEYHEQPWTSSWKSKGSSRQNLQLLERKCFCTFSSILFFFTPVSQIFNFLFYYQYIEQGGFKAASFSWVHLFSVPYTLILIYYFALQDCFFAAVWFLKCTPTQDGTDQPLSLLTSSVLKI